MAQRGLSLKFAEAEWINTFDFSALTASQKLGIEHLASRDDFAVLRSIHAADGEVMMQIVPSPALVALVPALAPYVPTATAGVAV